LSYEQSPEGGAEFRVSLPYYAAPPELQEVEPAGLRLGTRRILVVDEDPVVQRLVSALFAPEGHLVEAARTGEQALRRIGECPFDLIISESRILAGPSELFVRALAEACPEAGGYLVLAHDGEVDLPDPFPGVTPYRMRKPFNLRELHAIALQVFANNLPHSPASTAGR
jgi:DNA-binding NtrC family response regulator